MLKLSKTAKLTVNFFPPKSSSYNIILEEEKKLWIFSVNFNMLFIFQVLCVLFFWHCYFPSYSSHQIFCFNNELSILDLIHLKAAIKARCFIYKNTNPRKKQRQRVRKTIENIVVSTVHIIITEYYLY